MRRRILYPLLILAGVLIGTLIPTPRQAPQDEFNAANPAVIRADILSETLKRSYSDETVSHILTLLRFGSSDTDVLTVLWDEDLLDRNIEPIN